jgi:hypothetical protein
MPNRYDDVMHALGARFAYASRGLQPASLSEAELVEIESELGHSLPEDYREFLRDYGGFTVGNAGFPLRDNPDYLSGSSVDIFHVAGTVPWIYTEGNRELLEQNGPFPMEFYQGLGLVRPVEEDEAEFEWPPELIEIGQDAGGSRVCLAIAGLRPGATFFWYDRGHKGGQGVYLIADSFDEFIRSLEHT